MFGIGLNWDGKGTTVGVFESFLGEDIVRNFRF